MLVVVIVGGGFCLCFFFTLKVANVIAFSATPEN